MTNQSAPTKNPYVQSLEERFPRYHQFTAADLKQLPEGDIRGLLGALMTKSGAKEIVPRSFTQQYGDAAPAELALAVQREAVSRGKPELYALGLLNGAMYNLARKENPNFQGVVRSEVAASVELQDGRIAKASAPKITSHIIMQAATEHLAQEEKNKAAGKPSSKTFEVVIPPSVIDPIIQANPNLPRDLLGTGIQLTGSDEMAFMAGYASRAGASKEIGATTLEFTPKDICILKPNREAVFNFKVADVDPGYAGAFGYIQHAVDTMSPQLLTKVLDACPKKVASR